MNESDQNKNASGKEDMKRSRDVLEKFFIHSLEEMYYAENAIAINFINVKEHIDSPKLREILEAHFTIHLKHTERLEKIFQLRKKKIRGRKCVAVIAMLAEAKNHLSLFAEDIVNWEIGLILVSQKLAHYKIASYGGLAHLAINLEFYPAATLLAISVQEEEDYINSNLNGIFNAFLATHVQGFKG